MGMGVCKFTLHYLLILCLRKKKKKGTAAQVVPSIVGRIESLTQIVCSKHWIFPMHNFSYPTVLMDFTLLSSGHAPSSASYLPHRGERLSFLHEQVGSPTSPVEAKSCREVHAKGCIGQVHNLLIPDFDVGCKVWKKTTLRSSSKYHTNERLRLQRRIFDCGYLDSLHKEKLLLTDEQILGVLPDGLLTTNDFVPAHVIVLATGFQTNMFVP